MSEETSTAPRRRGPGWGIGIVGIIVGFLLGLIAAPRPAPTPAIIASNVDRLGESPASREPLVIDIELNGQKTQVVGNPLLADASSGATYVLGRNDAKITMIEFGDYRCGYCHQHAAQVLPRLKKDYIDTGKLRYIYRDTVTVGGEQTVAVSSVASCVNEQGKFWPFHEAVHANYQELGGQNGAALVQALVGIAEKVGANTSSLETCTRANKYVSRLQTEVELSRRFGVTGTPSFVINGYFFSGALPFEAYQKIFETLGV
jgi:protein-disulfide isomerase